MFITFRPYVWSQIGNSASALILAENIQICNTILPIGISITIIVSSTRIIECQIIAMPYPFSCIFIFCP